MGLVFTKPKTHVVLYEEPILDYNNSSEQPILRRSLTIYRKTSIKSTEHTLQKNIQKNDKYNSK